MKNIADINKEYEIVIDGNVLGLEDQLAMAEAWYADSPWDEIGAVKAKIAERDARIAAVLA